MHTVQETETVSVMKTGVELTALNTWDHATVAVLDPVLDQTTMTVMNVVLMPTTIPDSVYVTNSGAMIAVPNTPVLVTASVTHVTDQLKQSVMLVLLMPLTSYQPDNVRVTQTGTVPVVEPSSDSAHQPAKRTVEIQHSIALISMPMIVSSALRTHTVTLMDLAFASRTGAMKMTVQDTMESVTVAVLRDVLDQLLMIVSVSP